jgi:hypothetical protein
MRYHKVRLLTNLLLAEAAMTDPHGARSGDTVQKLGENDRGISIWLLLWKTA